MAVSLTVTVAQVAMGKESGDVQGHLLSVSFVELSGLFMFCVEELDIFFAKHPLHENVQQAIFA